ncbi:hypothetical protein WK21_20635 [Burkholderia cepacia]|nr:hypothetical protein WK21_20635 [Burkholderia cepacia]
MSEIRPERADRLALDRPDDEIIVVVAPALELREFVNNIEQLALHRFEEARGNIWTPGEKRPIFKREAV